MRLGQLARRYNVSLQDVISYLNEIDPAHDSLHHNSKLDEQIELMVVEHFDVKLDAPEDPLEVVLDEDAEESESMPEESSLEIHEETEADLQMELDPSLPPIKIQESPAKTEKKPKKEHEVIETDRLIEILESDDSDVDLSNITLIKAPKKELEGLKVVGKIDLPEPKSNSTKKSKQQEQEDNLEKEKSQQRQRLNDEDQEKRRLKAKRKKEDYERRQEKRRKDEKNKQRKAQNKARYEQKMQQIKASQPKRIIQKQEISTEVNEIPAKPKTILGTIWDWLKA